MMNSTQIAELFGELHKQIEEQNKKIDVLWKLARICPECKVTRMKKANKYSSLASYPVNAECKYECPVCVKQKSNSFNNTYTFNNSVNTNMMSNRDNRMDRGGNRDNHSNMRDENIGDLFRERHPPHDVLKDSRMPDQRGNTF